MIEPIEPTVSGDCNKVLLSSTNAIAMPDNSFRFNVNLEKIQGENVRCAVKKVQYPPPATYISRRLWFANANTWKNSVTGSQVNDYNDLLAKYGLYVWIYLYYPKKNMYLRILFNNAENTQVRSTSVSSSIDGVNWSATTSHNGIGLSVGVDYSSGASIPFDCYEIDITTQPMGTRLQNIHCPQLKASRSYDSTTRENTDIIGNIGNNQNFNQYVQNDITYKVKDDDCANEVSGSMLRGLTSLDIYFSRVATPTVKETVALPWSIELVLYAQR